MNDLVFRKATINDLDEIMTIYSDAREFMRNSGNKDQWTNGYPQRELTETSISDGDLYVCVDDEAILCVYYFKIHVDPTYVKIYNGNWLNDEPYGVIHRIAVAKSARGRKIASKVFEECLKHSKNLRIDTHRANTPMQRTLEKNGFKRCGIIHLENGDERLAFQKSI